jgi:4-hydroxybenzoate polyprenyltransferase
MPPPNLAPLWRRAVRESLWGKRGLVKTGALWLPVAVLLWALPAAKLGHAWSVSLLIFIVTACWGLSGTLVNDMADRADDLAAGKDRWILEIPPAAGVGVVLGLVGLGLLPILLSGAGAGVLAAYLAAVALGVAYSASPLRLKDRGLLGPLAFAAMIAVAFALLPWAWIGGPAVLTVLLFGSVFLDKWVNLHFHQIVDFEADSRQGRGTYAVRVGIERARRTLTWAAGLASLATATVLVWLAVKVLPVWATLVAGALAAAAGVYARLARRKADRATALVRELPAHYLALTYTVFRILPPILLALLALREPTLWVIAAIPAVFLVGDSLKFIRYRYH